MPWPAAGTVLDFRSNFRDVEPSFLVHPCLSGFIFGELRSRATCMGAIGLYRENAIAIESEASDSQT